MIGSLVGAGLGIAGSIFGGIKASQAMKKAKANIEEAKQDNQNWFDRRYNEDGTQRADVQRLLTMTRDELRKRNKASAGTAAVMGTAAEGVAASKSANNEAMANAISQIAANADARKDSIESQYLSRKGQLQDQLNNLESGKAQGIAQAVGGLSTAAGAIGSSIDDYRDESASLLKDK
jgi:hypothetical protein